MNAQDHVAAAVAATAIVGDHGFAWFGKRPPRLPRTLVRAFEPQVRSAYLTQALAEHLYGYFYVKGHASPMHWEAPTPNGASASFLLQLQRSNAGTGVWEDAWQVAVGSCEPGQVHLDRGGVRVSVLNDRLVRSSGPRIAELRMPKELFGRSPGYYLALSDAPMPSTSPVVRVYWNCRPRGALELVRHVTTSLNADGVPYQLKVLEDPAAFDRCDAAVLYLPAEAFPAAHPHLERTQRLLADDSRPRVPVFTKALAPGVGLAEDTDEGRSFGMQRCRVLAGGLVEASTQGRRTLGDRLACVEDHFERHGVRLDAPYLRPGSTDDYPGFVQVVSRVAETPGASVLSTADQLLDVALGIADRIVAGAYRDAASCTWIGSLVPDGTGQVLATLGPTLYDGLAGVALLLAQLPGQRFADTARAALDQASRHREDVPPARRAGLFDGWTGVALATAHVANRLDDRALRRKARAAAHEALAYPCTENDVISGAAGAILAALSLVVLTEDRTFLDDAVRLGSLLLERATPTGDGLSWSTINRKGEYHLTGLSHGTAGIALALLELAAVTSEGRFLTAAEAGFRHERAWFDPAVGNWPDLRETRATRGASSGALAYSTYWCHGAPGIALTRLRAWQITGDVAYRDETLAAITTTRTFLGRTDVAADHCLCHGVLGNAIMLAFAGRAVTDPASERVALGAVVRALTSYADGRWPLGTPGESPGLMLGLSGIAHALLWLRDRSEPMVLLPGLPPMRPEEEPCPASSPTSSSSTSRSNGFALQQTPR